MLSLFSFTNQNPNLDKRDSQCEDDNKMIPVRDITVDEL
jgi:hypothetical protein